MTDYGIKRELAAEFIVRYHQVGEGRLLITTNLTGEEIAERYTARLTSSIKELCLPLHLKGADKRCWAKATGPKQRSQVMNSGSPDQANRRRP